MQKGNRHSKAWSNLCGQHWKVQLTTQRPLTPKGVVNSDDHGVELAESNDNERVAAAATAAICLSLCPENVMLAVPRIAQRSIQGVISPCLCLWSCLQARRAKLVVCLEYVDLEHFSDRRRCLSNAGQVPNGRLTASIHIYRNSLLSF